MNASTRALALDILRSTADIFLVVLMVLAPSFVAEAASNVDLQVAETVLLYQRLSGGWPKNYDREQELTDAQRQRVLKERRQNDATVDNGATHTEIRLLAEAYTKTRDIRFKEAALRGIRYLLDGQYKNGGWPQRFPGSSGYQRYITFNDNAMVGILNLLKEVADGKVEYAFVPGDVRQECAQAVQHGIECILKCQIVVAGEPTAWCAQHDHVTLKPRPARSYELASLSGAESVGIVRFLMGIENPDDEVIRAIEGSVNWFERSKLEGIKLVRKEDASKPKGFDYVVVEDPDAPPLWARFYDIKTNQPIFCSRDGVPRRTLAEIAYERRTGYSWLGPYARELLDKDLPDWRRRLSSETSVSKTQSKPAPKAEAVLLRAVTTLDAADEERQTADREEITSWEQSYKAGYVDGQGRYAGGSEILHLEGHKGKLYAANSYWMDPSNIWYGGKDPKTAWSQILRLDRPNGKWEVDLELGPNNLRAENLKSVTFGTDGAGNNLEEPVTLLTATAYSPNPQGADINVFVRDDDTGTWEKTVLLRGTGESGENNSTRCMTVYRDRVTGVDRLFLPVGLLGIFTGVYDPDVPGKIRWDKASETGRLGKRSLAIIEANDSLFYSSGTKIYRRNDGPSPTHSMIFDASQLSKGPVASPVGGVRGLSVIPNPKGPGESLLFVWAPDSRSRSCVVRLDREKNGKYTHTKEECVADLMSEYLSGTPVHYALAGYNNILPVLNPTTKEPAYLMGFECWVGGRQFPCWQGNERGGFYAGAMYAIRDKNARYWLNEVNGPANVDKRPLQAVRTYAVSPFESEDGKVIYFGGFVADHGPSHNTAWVYKTSVENALRKEAPRPNRLTPEQSKAQLAALRQPYRFEYRNKPAFTIQIPGEFAQRKATNGNVFHASKAFNTLSISVSQSGDPHQAAKRYVEALKRVGNGKAEMVTESVTKLPDGTPAVEFLVKWVTKQNAVQTTQALTACDDGHSVTVATHTWEVGLPDKRFFFTLKFE